MYDKLIEELDGKEFDTYEDYELAVKAIVEDMEYELGKAERWASQNNKEILEQVGVVIKDQLEEDD
jgi:hypothetical protein